jgi:hypothetical protein
VAYGNMSSRGSHATRHPAARAMTESSRRHQRTTRRTCLGRNL